MRRLFSVQELATKYPLEDAHDIIECLDSILCDRTNIFATVADLLPGAYRGP